MARALSDFRWIPATAIGLFVWIANNWLEAVPRQILFYVALALTGNNLQLAVPLDIGLDVCAYCAFLFTAGTCYFAVVSSERNVWTGVLLGCVCWIIQRMTDFFIKLLWPYYGFYWDVLGLAAQVGLFSAAGAAFRQRASYAKST